MINNYTVVQADSIQNLIIKVNALIALGWQPLGGPAFEVTRTVYLQAMWTSMTHL